jgi:hypothetical protein
MPEKDEALGPGLELTALQGAHRFRFQGAESSGTQKQDESQGYIKRWQHSRVSSYGSEDSR